MKYSKCFSAKYNLSIVGILFSLLLAIPAMAEVNKSPVAEEKRALTLGFFPIISTVALYKRFGPLAKYLSEELNRPVLLKTAKNFPTFVKRTKQRAYDIAITAPHFAVKANDSGAYNIRATLISNVQQLVVVQKQSSISSITELSGRLVSTPPQKALMTKMGKDMFRTAGLSGDLAPMYKSFTSHNAANEAVLAGETVAAIASSNVIKKSLKRGDALKIIGKGLEFPNMATIIAADIDKKIGSKVVDVLVNMKQTEKGRAVLKKISFPGYRPVKAEEYEVVRPYL